MNTIKKIILKIITSNIEGELYEDIIIRAIIVNLYTIVGFFSLLFFGLMGIKNHQLYYSLAIFTFLIIDFFVFIIHQKFKNTNFAANFLVISLFILELLLLSSLGKGYTGLFWFFVFPIFTIFVIGRVKGFILSLLLIFIAIVYILFPLKNFTLYNSDIIIRFVFIYLLILTFVFIIDKVREKTFFAFKQSDRKKAEYLEKIIQQREELILQKHELNDKNIELEKLSIIASRTDNSIIVTDINTKVEWVNKGFEKITGYNLEEFQNLCPTLISCSQNVDEIKKCIEEKVTVNYVSKFFDYKNDDIWLQSTITPIFDENNEITKLFIVESDITLLKQKEIEIAEMNIELNLQKKEIISQKDLLQQKNDLISSYINALKQSITYSLQIQKSILPPKHIINEKFENFILLKPKDIVSGDFYWFFENDNYYFFAVVDCTGHGVPGAFMSIIGIRLLNEIVGIEKYSDPAEILNKLHDKFFVALDQQYTLNYDGMDIIIVRAEKNQNLVNKISYAGAKRPLIYFDAFENELVYLKSTRRSIGGIQSEFNVEKFETSEINIPLNSYIYLTTDGFVDQHNDARIRIGTSIFNKIIGDISLKSAKDQFNYLQEFFEIYKENQVQTDDVLVWGIKM